MELALDYNNLCYELHWQFLVSQKQENCWAHNIKMQKHDKIILKQFAYFYDMMTMRSSIYKSPYKLLSVMKRGGQKSWLEPLFYFINYYPDSQECGRGRVWPTYNFKKWGCYFLNPFRFSAKISSVRIIVPSVREDL